MAYLPFEASSTEQTCATIILRHKKELSCTRDMHSAETHSPVEILAVLCDRRSLLEAAPALKTISQTFT